MFQLKSIGLFNKSFYVVVKIKMLVVLEACVSILVEDPDSGGVLGLFIPRSNGLLFVNLALSITDVLPQLVLEVQHNADRAG